MKWTISKIKCHKIGFGIFSWVFVCVLSCFVFSHTNTYAVEDITIDIPSNTTSVILCSNTDSNYSSCDYTYVKFYCPTFSLNYNYIVLGYQFRSLSREARIYPYFNEILDFSSLISFDNGNPISRFSVSGSSTYANSGCTITLTNNSPFSGITPSGSLSITENGTYDVTNYSEAVVNVSDSSGGSSEGNYHEDLVAINNSILICGAICLVLYFFYCIYRMIIKSTGGF